MKRILIACPLNQSSEEWDKVNKLKADLFDAGNEVTDLQEASETKIKNDVVDQYYWPLLISAAIMLDRCDELLLMPNWKASKECRALEAIARIYNIPCRSTLTDQTNFALRKFGDICPMQYMVDDEPARVSETQCKPCDYCKGINPAKGDKPASVICKMAQGL